MNAGLPAWWNFNRNEYHQYVLGDVLQNRALEDGFRLESGRGRTWAVQPCFPKHSWPKRSAMGVLNLRSDR